MLQLQLEAQRRNYIVSVPTTEERYDCILDDGHKLYKAQVKYNNEKDKNNLRLTLARKHLNQKCYMATEVDIIFVYIPAVDEILAFLPEEFNGKNHIYINITDNNSPNYYEKFLW